MSKRLGRSSDVPHPPESTAASETPSAASTGPAERDRYEALRTLRARERFPVHVVLDNLRSAFNVGSIIRTSDAARVMHVHLCGITARPPHVKLARTALGASRHVPWTHHTDAAGAVRWLKDRGVMIAALETSPRARSYLEVDFEFPLALVLGHEVHGVGPGVLEQTDQMVTIPMWGVKNSLNVATAYGVVIFEVLRRYGATTLSAARDCTS